MIYVENDAVLSECGRYRYLLRRTWDARRPRALMVMLNPSTADAKVDDPTIRSCVRILNALHYGSMEVVNLFAWRATKPDELLTAENPVGRENDDAIKRAVRRCDMPICAWGKHPATEHTEPGSHETRWRHVVQIIRWADRPALFCLGKNADGSPRHPLYLKTGTPLEAFP